ncbi:MAG: phage holin family protein [Gammaproteobacteria bacterium]
MQGFLIRLMITAGALWLASAIVPGMGFATGLTLLWAALWLGIVNALIRPILILLTLPLTLLTLGLFLLVINAAMLGLVASLLDGFSLTGFWSALFGAILVSIFSGLASNFIGSSGRYNVLIVRRDG